MKIRVKNIFIYSLFLWTFFSVVSTEMGSSFPILYSVNSRIQILVIMMIIVKIIYVDLRRYRVRDFCIIFLIAIMGYCSAVGSRSEFLKYAFWFLAGVKDVDEERCIKGILYAHISAMVIIVVTWAAGFHQTQEVMRDSVVRYSLGYYHPNEFAAIVLQMMLMHLYLNRKELKPRVFIFYSLIAIVTYGLTRSITCVSLMIFVTTMYYLLNNSKNHVSAKKTIKYIVRLEQCIAVAFAVLSILFSFRSDIGQSIFGDFHSRIEQMGVYFAFYSVKPWGQPLMSHTSPDYDWRTNLYTLDNSYAHMLLELGVIVFCVFMALEIVLLKKEIKNKEYVIAVILITYMIWGFTETYLIRMVYNFTIILFGSILWNNYNKGYDD